MAPRELRTLLEGGAFFEDPRWQGGRWWVSDFYRHLVLTVDPDGGSEEVMTVEAQPSGLGWLPDGSLLVVGMKDHKLYRRAEDGEVTVHADLADLLTGHANDLVVDSRGRAYVGCFGFDLMGGGLPAETVLVRVDPDGTASVAADGLRFPNGSVITPDGLTLIVGETFAGRYTAFTIGDDGRLTDRRVWGQVGEPPELARTEEMEAHATFAPDGCTLDAEGHIWAADAIGGRCVRLAPGGDIVEEIAMPEGMGAFACMLGGDDGRRLVICAAPDFLEHKRAQAREGVLLTTEVDVPHAGLP